MRMSSEPSNARFTMLIVDDDVDVLSSLRRYFRPLPYRIWTAEGGQQALECLTGQRVDMMLLDLKMPDRDGLDVLKEALTRMPDLKIIMLTGHGGVREAVMAIQNGALDFFEKSTCLDMLRKKIDQAYRMWLLDQENQSLRQELEGRFCFDALVGESPPMLQLKDLVARVSPTRTSVLIQGESGTGKELVARAIHEHSNRKSEVYIPVDCAAISASIIESELFGHTKGAFTGADHSTLGLIRSADKGTLFLDEIGELPLEMQAKFLRSVQEQTVRPVGATSEFPIDVRVVAATHRNLIEEMARGRFRQDLYYRLSAVTLYVPSLRERGDDILLLARYFIKALSREGMPFKTLSEEAARVLCAHTWPGNVRELENVIRNAMAFARGHTILARNLPALSELSGVQPPIRATASGRLADVEREAITRALRQTGGNRRKAARLLGISEATIYRRLKQYAL
jgi:DNA-binding NtrC family response regulator